MEAQIMSPAQFFAENRSIAGFDNPARGLYTSIREFVENGLDAAEEISVLPEIKVRLKELSKEELQEMLGISKELLQKIGSRKEKTDVMGRDFFELIVRDNGRGMEYESIPTLMGKVLTSTKYRLRQQRGRFGLGGKMATIYALQETNAPINLWSRKKGKPHVSHFIYKIDLEKNEPRIRYSRKIPAEEYETPWGEKLEHGTIIKLATLGDWLRSKSQITEYFKKIAVITPYASLLFEDPEGDMHFYERVSKKIPPPPKETKYHLKGVDTQLLLRLARQSNSRSVGTFLKTTFQRIGEKTVQDFLGKLDIDPKTPLSKLKKSDKLATKIVEIAKRYDFIRPRSDCLSPVGTENLMKGIKAVEEPDFVTALQRDPIAYQGHPLLVEVGVGYGGGITPGIKLHRYANRVPLLYKKKSGVCWKGVQAANLKHYKLKQDSPVSFIISIVSTKIPFPETSKDFITNVDPLRKEVKLAIQDVLRDLRSFLSKKRKKARKRRKQRVLARYAEVTSESLSQILKSEEQGKDNPYYTDRFLLFSLIDLIQKESEKS
ncbi:MAG: DNA topoisomerase VI subunit B [Candidatus Korarchaeota archaeon]|nr:DNA topoisomerase VI subunit B [Candidatus Korarchaeota archaeon]NIU82476.1 DNA topoisomerase VI subunit B [Candidatus Thorarchaeota archaeon]NIW12962.1 DNA topoisomerase VI subunit B [Candidatus Thorarchaeota archaeon]NIW51115.1 DNA topoisomerase VI subunit B [Candidatus Korarchaeota archaeon]